MKLYNTKTRHKEEFIPHNGNKVSVYSCGPTVYDYFHIGNARPFIIFDILCRYLRYKGYDVTHVQNFTDIDDKMIKRAAEMGITVQQLGEMFIEEYYKYADALYIKRSDIHPKATEHIDEIIEIVNTLMEKGLAYASQGDVYFRARKFPDYGCLSRQNLDELDSGIRVDIGEQKEDPLDFVLWKAQKPGEPAWDSPWGKGRPGWHIECSAMSMKYLGDTIDIHTGGQDLIFPHHENEIAQSEGATGQPFVRYWLHNGFINIDGEKMSKSGSFFTVKDISQRCDLEAVRLFLISAHYRSQINFSEELLAQSVSGLKRLYTARDNYEFLLKNAKNEKIEKNSDKEFSQRIDEIFNNFIYAMDDDLNTADALGAIYELIREANIALDQDSPLELVKMVMEKLRSMLDILGLVNKSSEKADAKIEELIQQRSHARANKDWALSDKIRDEIKELGYIIEDTPQGTKYKKA